MPKWNNENITDAQLYDQVTNYQSPDMFLEFLTDWNLLEEYVEKYVNEIKDEILAPDCSVNQAKDSIIKYLEQCRSDGVLENFPPE